MVQWDRLSSTVSEERLIISRARKRGSTLATLVDLRQLDKEGQPVLYAQSEEQLAPVDAQALRGPAGQAYHPRRSGSAEEGKYS